MVLLVCLVNLSAFNSRLETDPGNIVAVGLDGITG